MKKYFLILLLSVFYSCVSNNQEKDTKVHQNEESAKTNPDGSPALTPDQQAPLTSAQADGKTLFENNCTACHALNEKLIGPELKGADKRHSREWLQKFIRNSQAMIKAGDPVAVKLYKENNESVMTAFEHFSDQDIDNIIAYIQAAEANEVVVEPVAVP